MEREKKSKKKIWASAFSNRFFGTIRKTFSHGEKAFSYTKDNRLECFFKNFQKNLNHLKFVFLGMFTFNFRCFSHSVLSRTWKYSHGYIFHYFVSNFTPVLMNFPQYFSYPFYGVLHSSSYCVPDMCASSCVQILCINVYWFWAPDIHLSHIRSLSKQSFFLGINISLFWYVCSRGG